VDDSDLLGFQLLDGEIDLRSGLGIVRCNGTEKIRIVAALIVFPFRLRFQYFPQMGRESLY
jgi:hypothetical protein